MFGRSRQSFAVSLAMLAGFAAAMNPISRRPDPKGTATGWRRPLNTLWRDSPEARAAALVKRERRCTIVRRNVAAGAYGLLPYAGTKGYIANTHHGRTLRHGRTRTA